jgi:DNA polymerase-3 subunit gamma/tau
MVGAGPGLTVIANQLKSRKIRRSIIIAGPIGTGKTTLGRIIGQSMLCLKPNEDGTPCFECTSCKAFKANGVFGHPDYLEENMGVDTGVDHARSLVRLAAVRPMYGRYRFFLLDEAQKLTEQAKSALLKLYEEPPEHVIVVICTMSPESFSDKAGKAILSRGLRIDTKCPTENELVRRMITICKAEDAKVPVPVLKAIAAASDYMTRDCLTNLELAIASDGFNVPPEQAFEFISSLNGQSPFTLAKKALSAFYHRDLAGVIDALSASPNHNFMIKTLVGANADVLRFRHLPQSINNQYARWTAEELARVAPSDQSVGVIGNKLQEIYLQSSIYALDAGNALIHLAASLWKPTSKS